MESSFWDGMRFKQLCKVRKKTKYGKPASRGYSENHKKPILFTSKKALKKLMLYQLGFVEFTPNRETTVFDWIM